MSRPEILAPAGNREMLGAAVFSGADAVYLGLTGFNARRTAGNFTPDELREAVAFCHARGVKVHVTLNTLVYDRELSGLADAVRAVAAAGADAVIADDLATAQLVKSIAPTLHLHGSTQMSVHTPEGAKELAALGYDRVILARELSLEEIRAVCEASPIEVEVFVHGALCMSVSGQCMMSAFLGGRSGNRGACAGPCRLPIDASAGLKPGQPGRACHLSLKDMDYIPHLRELMDAGVASVKIEGRLRTPEYAAAVVTACRAVCAGQPYDEKLVRDIFSRSGFTDGYLTNRNDGKMFGVRTEADAAATRAATPKARELFRRELQRVPVHYELSGGVEDGGVKLTARDDDGHRVSVYSADEPQPAQKDPLPGIERALGKTGGTPFYIENMRIEVQDGLMIPASVMNGMRRDALNLLLAKRGVAPSRDWLHGSVLPRDDEAAAREGFRGYTAAVRTKAQADALRELGLETVYVPLEVAAQTGLPAILPRVFSDNEQPQIEMLLGEAMSRGTDTVLAGNIGHIPLAKRLGFTVHGDFGLNAYNSKTLSALAEMGVSRQTLSFEARLAQIRDMRGPLETDLIVYGRLPLMIFENCAIRRQHGGKCSCQNGVTYLTDRRKERFPLLNEFGCRNTLLNSRPLCLREDFSRLGIQTARLQFTIESPEECARIARAFLSGAPLDGEFTNGLYKRGVE